MKKITSTILFIFLFVSANANIFTDLTNGITNNKAEITITTTLTAIAGSIYYYKIKNNDFKVFKKFEKLIKENPKVGATILATITSTVGLTAAIIFRRCKYFDYTVLTGDDIYDINLIDNKGKIAAITILTALMASVYYYEIQYNDFKVFKKVKKLIKENPKAGATVLAAITAALGLIIDIASRCEESLVSNFLYDAFDFKTNPLWLTSRDIQRLKPLVFFRKIK